MFVSEWPLHHTWKSKSTNTLFDMLSLGPNTFILSFNSSGQALFNGVKHKTSKGCILSVTWGGSFKIVISPSLAFSINDIDTCDRCPS